VITPALAAWSAPSVRHQFKQIQPASLADAVQQNSRGRVGGSTISPYEVQDAPGRRSEGPAIAQAVSGAGTLIFSEFQAFLAFSQGPLKFQVQHPHVQAGGQA
jgi:hypothetical protein